MLKKLLGIAPQLEPDGSYRPSKLALKLATSPTTDYEEVKYEPVRGKKKKIFVLFTEQKNMEMKNGRLFSTGNHPVEALVPMLHLKSAGFEFEIATPTGKPVVMEMWAMPQKDEAVMGLYEELLPLLENPLSLAEFVDGSSGSFGDVEQYAAIFVPGGHGSMLGIPDDPNVALLLHWAHDHGLFTISLCHGPGAFLTTATSGQEFLYKGYKMAVFPDSVDKMTPTIGYLPGHMPFGLSERMKELGATVVNTKGDATCCLDRTLITGASPLASNELGKLSAKTLLEALQEG